MITEIQNNPPIILSDIATIEEKANTVNNNNKSLVFVIFLFLSEEINDNVKSINERENKSLCKSHEVRSTAICIITKIATKALWLVLIFSILIPTKKMETAKIPYMIVADTGTIKYGGIPVTVAMICKTDTYRGNSLDIVYQCISKCVRTGR